jgi:HlyD family secretion protein
LLVLAVVTLVIPLVVFAGDQFQVDSATAETTNLQLHTIGRAPVEVVVSAVGSVEPNEVIALSFTSAGRIDELYVAEGDVVMAGDLLAQQENATQRIAYEQAVLGVEAARLSLDDLRSGPDESAIRIAQANLDSAWGQYRGIQNAVTQDDIRAAELRYEQALAAVEDAEQRRATADGDQSDEAYSLLDAQIGQASFNAEIARLQLESLRSGSRGQATSAYARVLQAQAELERAEAGPTQAEIDRAEVNLQQAINARDDAETALERTLLTAPVDGVVSRLDVEVGSLVTPGRSAIELTGITPLKVSVLVDEVDIRQVDVAMPARVQLDALTGVLLPARVEQIALLGRNEGGIVSYEVQLLLESDDPRVRVGMTAEASLIVEAQADVLAVPNIYVRLDRQTDQSFVNIVRPDGSIEEVEVELGLQGRDNSEIIAGLAPGDVVALDLSGEGFSFGG